MLELIENYLLIGVGWTLACVITHQTEIKEEPTWVKVGAPIIITLSWPYMAYIDYREKRED